MTNQIPDTIEYKGEVYQLLIYGYPCLPTPEMFGMEARSASTALVRGYFAHYQCIQNRLILQEFVMGYNKGQRYKPIAQKMPVDKLGFHRYENLAFEVESTCCILIFQDRIFHEYPISYIFPHYLIPLNHRKIIGLQFHNGNLTSAVDYSGIGQRIRKQLFIRKLLGRDISYNKQEELMREYMSLSDYGWNSFQ